MRQKTPYLSFQTVHTGFTLVEVLVAMTLFSFILVMIFSSLHSANRSWQAGNMQAQGNDEQRLALSFLRRQLEQTVPLFFVKKDSNTVLFKGKDDMVSFVADMPSHHGGRGLYLWSLVVVRELDGSRHLDLRYQLVTPALDLLQPGDENKDTDSLVLIEKLDDIELSYFGKQKDAERPDWYHTWEDQERLPKLVRLHIVTGDEHRYWPDVLANLRAEGERGQPQFALKADGDNALN